MADVAALRSDLDDSRARLFAAIQGLEEEQFRLLPADGSWPIAAHLAHLLRCERLSGERAHSALQEHDPQVASTNVLNDADAALAASLAIPQIIHGLQAARRSFETALAAGDVASERAIVHERLGRITVAQMAVKMASHEREHAAEVERSARMMASARRVTIPITPRS